MTIETTSKSTQKVQRALLNHGITPKIVEFAESTRTAQEAAHQIGCTVAQIVKSLVFCTQVTDKPVLVLTSGINRVNEKTIEKLVGEKIKKADADFVRNITGFAIGGVPPLAHTCIMITLIDEDLLQYKELWAAAGTPHTVFSLTPSDLITITNGTVARIQ